MSRPGFRAAAILLAMSTATAVLAAPPHPRKPAAAAPATATAAAAEMPGPGWRIDENYTLDDGPVTPVASVANDEGFVFAVYGKPQQVVRFRLEIPAPGLELQRDQPLTMQVDAKTPAQVRRSELSDRALRRETLHVDPRSVEWEFGQYVPRTLVAVTLYQMRSGTALHLVLSLADGTTRPVDFSLRGARERLGNVAPPYTTAYVAENEAVEERGRIEQGVWKAQVAAEARCGAHAGDQGPPCARRMRDCILAYPEDVLSVARAAELIACFDAAGP